ncbi:MAG: preprotein translocase subunit SecG [Dysgonamonadaceae bacterium]|jgi:preprotein translocase subunit SecG|nr:preprotein translocase subunit SecG [Dysgonamonadaceae bacterium]
MYIFSTVLIVIASILLVFFVVIQNSKGGGLAAGFASSNQVMGVRKTTDFLEKMTWGLAVVVVFFSILASISFRHGKGEVSNSRLEIENIIPAENPNATAPFGTVINEQPAAETPAAE